MKFVLLPFCVLLFSRVHAQTLAPSVSPAPMSAGGGDPFAITLLTSEEFKQMLDDTTTKWFDVVVDVRTLNEWSAGHIAGATHVESLGRANTQASSPADLAGCEYCNLVAYGDSRARAALALKTLQDAGFVGRLYNGLSASDWTTAGYPLVTDNSVEPPCTVDTDVSEQCRLSYLAYTGGAVSPGTTAPVSAPVDGVTGSPVVSSPVGGDAGFPSVSAAPAANTANPTTSRGSSCKSNPICATQGLEGDCCPTMDDWTLTCCGAPIEETCDKNAECEALGLVGSCCPTIDDLYLDCCTTVPDDCQAGNSTSCTMYSAVQYQLDLEAAASSAPKTMNGLALLVATLWLWGSAALY